MVSIQKNLSVVSGFRQGVFQTAGKTADNKNISHYSVNREVFQFSYQIRMEARQDFSDQNAIFHFNRLSGEDKAALIYNDTPISELSADEAKELVSADGFFGIDKTSGRISNFVIRGAGDNIDRLRAGREGILRGFAEAEKAWGGKLPQISYETMEKSLEAVDEKIREMGGSVLDLST